MINSKVFDSAWDVLPAVLREQPFVCGLVTGSGWSRALQPDKIICQVAYADIPGLGTSTVQGHAGQLIVFEKSGGVFLAFMGRRHWYEGVGWESVVMPVELMRRLGIKRVLLTNAAGGIASGFKPGDFMLFRDHLNLTGHTPLQGPCMEGWGERFPDLSSVYAGGLSDALKRAASRANLMLHEGVYAFSTGPAYETPAEIAAYALLGVDAVGMSTVPEAVVAAACGFDVAALSCITNMAAKAGGTHLSHEEVLKQSETSQAAMVALLNAFFDELMEG